MYPSTYYGYYGFGYGSCMPHTTYPQTLQTTQSSSWPILVPLQSVAQYLPPHPFGAALGYHQQNRTSTSWPPWYPRAQTPWYTYSYAQAPWCAAPHNDYGRVTRAPWRSPSPEPRPPRHRVLPWTPWDTHSQLTVDPILAVAEPPFGALGLEWDLADGLSRNIFDRPENRWLRTSDLARAAVRDGTRALERLVLTFAAALPTGSLRERDANAVIEVTHAHVAPILGAVDGNVSWVTVYDVFVAISQWLVSPIGEREMRRLEGEQLNAVLRAAEARRWGRAGWAATVHVGVAPYLKIDYLGERRRFKGIRPALRDEVPVGRTLGEVFVVELGASG